jgi:hypothetical protein
MIVLFFRAGCVVGGNVNLTHCCFRHGQGALSARFFVGAKLHLLDVAFLSRWRQFGEKCLLAFRDHDGSELSVSARAPFAAVQLVCGGAAGRGLFERGHEVVEGFLAAEAAFFLSVEGTGQSEQKDEEQKAHDGSWRTLEEHTSGAKAPFHFRWRRGPRLKPRVP